MKNGKIDSAFYYLNKAKEMSVEKIVYDVLPTVLNTMAELYEEINEYEKALQYYYLTLKEVRNIENQNIIVHQNIRTKGHTLSRMGNIFYEINITDSALHYINLSKIFATENKFPEYLMENYLTLSKIEESKGNKDIAFDYFRKYANLKDSMQNAKILGEIKQLQRLYEVSKTDKQIEYLVTTQYVKEQTIHYQKIIVIIISTVLLLFIIGFIYIYLQKGKLARTYNVLFEKNLELIDSQNKTDKESDKNKPVSSSSPKKDINQNLQDEILEKILNIMKEPDLFCDPKFSIEKLSTMVGSNRDYVSNIIKTACNKNFRSFINSYRIKEAQKLLSELDANVFTIDYVGEKVGFMSRSAFINAFKENIGVPPSVYLKSITEKTGS